MLPNMDLIHKSFRTTILYAQLLLCHTVLSLLGHHKDTATCVQHAKYNTVLSALNT